MSRSACRFVYPAALACGLACWLYLLYARTFPGLSPSVAAYASAARDGFYEDAVAMHGRFAILLGALLMQWMPPWDTSIMLLATVARLTLALTVYVFAMRHVSLWIGCLAAFLVSCLPGASASAGYDGLSGLMASALFLAGWGFVAAESDGEESVTLPTVRSDIGASLSLAVAVCICPSLWLLWLAWLLFIAGQSREYLRARLGVTAGVSGTVLAAAWYGGWLSCGRLVWNTPWSDISRALGGVGLVGALVAGGYLMRTDRRVAALPHLAALVGSIGVSALSADPAAVACAAIGSMAMIWSLAIQEWADTLIAAGHYRWITVVVGVAVLVCAMRAMQPGIDWDARAQRAVLFKAGAWLADARDADAARRLVIREADLLHPLRIWMKLARPDTGAQRDLAAQFQPAIRRRLQQQPPDERTARRLLTMELARICRDGWSGNPRSPSAADGYGSRYASARQAREQMDKALHGDMRPAPLAYRPDWVGVTDAPPLTTWYGRGRWRALPDVAVHTSRNGDGRWERQADWNGVADRLRCDHVDAILLGRVALERQDAWGELTRRLLRQDDGEPRQLPAGFTLGDQAWAPVAWWPDSVVTARQQWHWVLYRPAMR